MLGVEVKFMEIGRSIFHCLMHYIFPDDSTGCRSIKADGRLPMKLLKSFVAGFVVLRTEDAIFIHHSF
jgi:hypothetical protein